MRVTTGQKSRIVDAPMRAEFNGVLADIRTWATQALGALEKNDVATAKQKLTALIGRCNAEIR